MPFLSGSKFVLTSVNGDPLSARATDGLGVQVQRHQKIAPLRVHVVRADGQICSQLPLESYGKLVGVRRSGKAGTNQRRASRMRGLSNRNAAW